MHHIHCIADEDAAADWLKIFQGQGLAETLVWPLLREAGAAAALAPACKATWAAYKESLLGKPLTLAAPHEGIIAPNSKSPDDVLSRVPDLAACTALIWGRGAAKNSETAVQLGKVAAQRLPNLRGIELGHWTWAPALSVLTQLTRVKIDVVTPLDQATTSALTQLHALRDLELCGLVCQCGSCHQMVFMQQQAFLDLEPLTQLTRLAMRGIFTYNGVLGFLTNLSALRELDTTSTSGDILGVPHSVISQLAGLSCYYSDGMLPIGPLDRLQSFELGVSSSGAAGEAGAALPGVLSQMPSITRLVLHAERRHYMAAGPHYIQLGSPLLAALQLHTGLVDLRLSACSASVSADISASLGHLTALQRLEIADSSMAIYAGAFAALGRCGQQLRVLHIGPRDPQRPSTMNRLLQFMPPGAAFAHLHTLALPTAFAAAMPVCYAVRDLAILDEPISWLVEDALARFPLLGRVGLDGSRNTGTNECATEVARTLTRTRRERSQGGGGLLQVYSFNDPYAITWPLLEFMQAADSPFEYAPRSCVPLKEFLSALRARHGAGTGAGYHVDTHELVVYGCGATDSYPNVRRILNHCGSGFSYRPKCGIAVANLRVKAASSGVRRGELTRGGSDGES